MLLMYRRASTILKQVTASFLWYKTERHGDIVNNAVKAVGIAGLRRVATPASVVVTLGQKQYWEYESEQSGKGRTRVKLVESGQAQRENTAVAPDLSETTYSLGLKTI
ncbi:hypothetical protein J6590_049098 [Homalodisca vitripennis]|nr:hypothetical protein J6590_049098 [Homalodisca vitripennis]